MCAILQLVSAPLNPIPIAEHFAGLFFQELDGPKAVELVTSARVEVSNDISQSNYENDDTEVSKLRA